jgi:hypothetical protein
MKAEYQDAGKGIIIMHIIDSHVQTLFKISRHYKYYIFITIRHLLSDSFRIAQNNPPSSL